MHALHAYLHNIGDIPVRVYIHDKVTRFIYKLYTQVIHNSYTQSVKHTSTARAASGPTMLVPISLLALGCAIEDGTAFGAPYTIAASPAPYIDAGELVFEATYKSTCPNSTFAASRFGESHVHDAPHILTDSIMIVASRATDACASPLSEREKTEVVRTLLPPSAHAGFQSARRFLACPPGSHYEMVLLEDKAEPRGLPFLTPSGASVRHAEPPVWDDEESGASGPGELDHELDHELGQEFDHELDQVESDEEDERTASSDPIKEARRVAEELATHTPSDSVAFLEHCEAKLRAGEAAGCCSPLMVQALRKKVAKDSAERAATAGRNASGTITPGSRATEAVTLSAAGNAFATTGSLQ